MKLTNSIEKEILNLIRNGYNAESIVLRLSKKYKDLKKSDVIIVAKKYGINKFGKKDLTTTKGKMKEAENNLAFAMTQKPLVDKIKKTLIGLFVAIVLLLVVIGVIFGIKPFLIGLGIVLGITVILCIISYFKFIKGNKEVSKLVDKELQKGHKKKK